MTGTTRDLAPTSCVPQVQYTTDLQWNQISNLKPSCSKAEILPLGQRLTRKANPYSSRHSSLRFSNLIPKLISRDVEQARPWLISALLTFRG
ncbi:hypothetical protein AVEN_103071-1 [Araneus ventricosus]|uniref:Uncharacterized protein n=1 Tax=Araneus ventricosus TaxID=182803 RepID=A0A4Y2B7Q9_ARAVE|nr:hypothetical protein AVEN_103071-1 [Araneus ventricosus]